MNKGPIIAKRPFVSFLVINLPLCGPILGSLVYPDRSSDALFICLFAAAPGVIFLMVELFFGKIISPVIKVASALAGLILGALGTF